MERRLAVSDDVDHGVVFVVRYRVEFADRGRSPQHVDAHALTMVLRAEGDEYLQYVGGLVDGIDLIRLPDDELPRLWSAVAVGITELLEMGIRRGKVHLGKNDAERKMPLWFAVDVFKAGKVARSDTTLPELIEGAVIREFTIP